MVYGLTAARIVECRVGGEGSRIAEEKRERYIMGDFAIMLEYC